MNSKPASPTDDDFATLPIELDDDLCQSCRILASELLTGDPHRLGPGWTRLPGHVPTASVLYMNAYHDRCIQSLVNASSEGCQICTLIVAHLAIASLSLTPEHPYQIAVWDRQPLSPEFCVELGTVEELAAVVSQGRFDQGESSDTIWTNWFNFYRRNGNDSAWLDEPRWNERAWPRLRVYADVVSESDESFDRANRWVAECVEGHENCKRVKGPLPKRVIDVRPTDGGDGVRLFESDGESAEYITLSYSWGTALPLRTIQANLKRHLDGILLHELPTTLKDAVTITRRLGFSYIWVDALCILQDDDEDWAEQAAQMTNIYRNSAVTISATSSTSCDDGVFRERIESGRRIGQYVNPNDRQRHGHVFCDIAHAGEVSLERKHLSTRGWCFQERLVSLATLHYTDEGLVWECASQIKPECDVNYHERSSKPSFHLLMQPTNARYPPSGSSATRHLAHWSLWIEQFTMRNLTQENDKLPAVAGITKAFIERYRMTYAAGLWREDFVMGLLWKRNTAKHYRRIGHLDSPTAPSWSWASVKHPVVYATYERITNYPKSCLEILDIKIEEQVAGSFGKVRKGHFEARGYLQELTVNRLFPADAQGFTANDSRLIIDLDDDKHSEDYTFSCWCLLVGIASTTSSAPMAKFLLVQPVDAMRTTFRRIGTAHYSLDKDADLDNFEPSSIMSSPEYRRLTMV